MKSVLFCLAMLMVFSPLVYAASDCEHSCCQKFSGSWDDDFDDCKHPKEGFDTCLSDCEAAVWAARPQGPGPADPENTYTYKCGGTEFILASAFAGALFLKKSRVGEG